MYKALFSGDRRWTDPAPVQRELERLEREFGRSNVVIITGKARGLDQLAAKLAKQRGIHVAEVQALWETYYKGAGPIRNAVMLAFEPDEVIGFHPDIENSKGTKHMVELGRKAGVLVKVVDG